MLSRYEGLSVKQFRNIWVLLISNLIWLAEKVFFYPKLKSAYIEMNLPNNTTQRDLVVFDVGANKGQSINFFRGVFPTVRIYAFEPSEKTFFKLKKVVGKVEGERINVFQMGMGKMNTTLNFYESILSETSTFALPDENSLYLKKKNRILFQKKRTPSWRLQPD
jgi:hypothetical protein